MKRTVGLLLALVMVAIMVPGLAEEVIIPRHETLTYNGQSWGTASSYNPLEAGGNLGFGTIVPNNPRLFVYETLFMYNMITGENEPLIALEAPVLEDGVLTVKLKENVTFNDGVPMTAKDVKFSFDVHNPELFKDIVTPYADITVYIASVEVVDDYTVKFVCSQDNYNPLMVETLFGMTPILPEHIWQPRWDEHGPAMTKLFNEDTVGTGAYKLYLNDDARQVLIRVEDYWGQADNMFGKLAAPKYVMHELYQNNDAGNIAFGEGRVDIAQQFMPSVWEYQERMKDENGQPLVKTYFSEKPYHLGWSMPSMRINQNRPGLDDYVVRKALALSLDYEAIGTNAMSGYTNDMILCYMNAYIFGDYIDWDDEELQALMWDTTALDANLEEANRLLDEAGYVDVDNDGIRELKDGSKYEWKAMCPAGWSDWNMTLDSLAEGAKKIGLNVVTYFPEAATYTTEIAHGNFDIAMQGVTPPPSMSMPWRGAFNMMYSKGVTPIGEFTNRNQSRFKNDRIDELVELTMLETDPDILKEYYTEINKIWLSELPTVPFMYRPYVFQTTYTYYWTGFASGDGETKIMPGICYDSAGLRELYLLEPTGRQ